MKKARLFAGPNLLILAILAISPLFGIFWKGIHRLSYSNHWTYSQNTPRGTPPQTTRNPPKGWVNHGAGDRDRTGDIQLGKLTFCH
jgi:hypothetical protein